MFYFPNNSNACQRFENVTLDREGDPDQNFSPIILIERGSCSFVRKARNVQEVGGALALVMNNVDTDPARIIMIDDGTGASIVIPTVLISKADGQALRSAIVANDKQNSSEGMNKQYVVVLVDFQIVWSRLIF